MFFRLSLVITLVLLLVPDYTSAAKVPLPKFGGSSPDLSLKSKGHNFLNANEEKLTKISNSVQSMEDLLKKIRESVSNNELGIERLLKTSEIFLNHVFYESCEDFKRREEDTLVASSKITSHNQINLLPPGGHLAKARCEIDNSGAAWTVVLDRSSGKVRFNRTYEEYKLGFGNTKEEYYIGNQALNELTGVKSYLLRIELQDSRSNTGWAEYKLFKVSSEKDGYKLTIGEFDRKSTLGDGLKVNNGMEFSTYDRDRTNKNCSANFGGNGGWWFTTGAKVGCYNSLPSGIYRPRQPTSSAGGISYAPWSKAVKPLVKFKILMKTIQK